LVLGFGFAGLAMAPNPTSFPPDSSSDFRHAIKEGNCALRVQQRCNPRESFNAVAVMSAKAALPGFRRFGHFSTSRASVYLDLVRMRSHDSFGRPKHKALRPIPGQFKNFWVVTQELSYPLMPVPCFLLRVNIRAAAGGLFGSKEMPTREPLLIGHEMLVVTQYVSS
jgi:hypothetical protein